MKKIPVDVITGPRGAGKSTFLQTFYDSGFYQGPSHLFLNEEGKASAPQLCRVHPMMGGCICCAQQTEFVDKMQKLLDTGTTDPIVVELAGTGSAGEFRKVFQELPACYPRLQLLVLDMSRFRARRVMMESLLIRQVSQTPVLLLNRWQQLPAEEWEADLSLLRQWNPDGICIPLNDENKTDQGYPDLRKLSASWETPVVKTEEKRPVRMRPGKRR